jgi:lipopolysaccharide transport system permease protein
MEKAVQHRDEWDLVIQPRNKWYDLRLKEIWRYRDLLFLFVKRDFVSVYKQTVMGPVWFFLQPLITTLTFTFIFKTIASISTDGIPGPLFYISGLTLWTFFADCLNKTAETFTSNAGVFSKVYFPRMVAPLSIVISNMIKLGVQFVLFLLFWFYYLFSGEEIHPHYSAFVLLPFLVLLMAGMGLGFGLLISSLTTKYKDLKFLVGFGVQLLMYASSVVLPLSVVPKQLKWLILLNPIISIIETFKYAFLGVGEFNLTGLLYSTVFCIVLIVIGFIVFGRVERSFVDTV